MDGAAGPRVPSHPSCYDSSETSTPSDGSAGAWRRAMMCTSIPAGAARRVIFLTMDPPPFSSCHRLRLLEPTTIASELDERLRRVLGPDLGPIGTDVGGKLAEHGDLTVLALAGAVVGNDVQDVEMGFDPSSHT
jgi:hypothetical protein